ncbi:hypothetical protein Hanom_Chr16g01503731 [Helianthus anomalus]
MNQRYKPSSSGCINAAAAGADTQQSRLQKLRNNSGCTAGTTDLCLLHFNCST